MGSHVLVAGATGVVGSRVVPLLVAAGHRVTALTRSADRAAALTARHPDIETVVVDVRDAPALRDAVTRAAPDTVMHQLTDLGAGDRAANAELRIVGTRHLVDAAHAAGVRRIVAQSIAFAYGPGTAPAREDEPLDPAQVGVIALETAVAEIETAVVLRFGLFHGPGTWYALDGAMAGAARAGSLVADDAVTSFVHVDDAAAAAVAALDWPAGAVNVCDDEPLAARDWVPAFCRAVGAPEPPTGTGRAPGARGADNRLARTERGWAPTRRTGWAPEHT
jgi:nucleoside-diphosphate-sugar epimerase